jgi:predicted nucleic acid-binding Zn ribbon protein
MADKREKMPRPAAVAELLSAVFHGTPTEKRLKEGSIWLVWDTAVGKQIAGRARPVSFRNGTLNVAVESAPWMQQLTFLKKGIMENLNARLGEELVRDIYLKAGKTEQVKSRTKPVKRCTRQLSAEERQKIAEQTDSVTDPELRKALTELLARHMETDSKD